jgi:hypothetical protein
MHCLGSSLLFLIGCGSAAMADSPPKPACTAANVGRFWPDEANDNPKFAAALTPYGYPEICTFSGKTYRWRSLTVPVNRLRKEPKRRAPASSNSAASPSAQSGK